MGALVGLGVGIGLMLVWSAFALPHLPRPPRHTQGRVGRLLARAGLGQVSALGFFLLCVTVGLVVAVLMEVVSWTPPVAV